MSDDEAHTPVAEPPRRPAPLPGPMRFMGGGPIEKSTNFKATAKRMFSLLRPERLLMSGVLLLGASSVALAVTGPKLLGNATNDIFAGFLGDKTKGAPSKAAAIASLQHAGMGSEAKLLGSVDFTPGRGIDFGSLGTLLLWILGVYLLAGVFGVFQGRLATRIVQRVVYRLRQDVESKLSRLPLKYFDKQPRGEVLSRVTNDIDNIAQSLQQSMSQIITSLLTIVGVLAMMF